MARTPKPVRDAAKRADHLHAEVYAEEGTDTGENASSDAEKTEGTQPQEYTQSKQEEVDQTQQKGENTDGKSEASEQEGGQPSADEKTWEQRFKTLQGKYNKEIPEMMSQIRSLEAKLSEVEQEADGLRKENESLKNASGPTQNGSEGEKTVASPEEIEEYGEDFVNFVNRIATKAAKSEAENLTPEIEKVRGEVQTSQQQTAQGNVYATLDQNMPNWRETNKDPGFVGWLAQTEPLSGQPRRQMLMQAFEAGDAQRVLAFFQAYSGTQEAQTQEPQESKVSLDQLAGPQRQTPAGQPQEQPQPSYWTRQDISDFYTKVQKGMISKEEKERLERDLASAMAEGRIK